MGVSCRHFAGYSFEHIGLPSLPSVALDPRPFRLEDVIPLTDFQRQSLTLGELLPVTCSDSAADWLDNDLEPILHFSEASLTLRTALLDVRLWRDAPASAQASRLDVFTDGSASGRVEPLRSAPAGWAFTVWVVAEGRSYFYGAAASTAVPPGTPFHLGETDDSSLQSELLGICWHSHGSSSMAPLLVCLVICALTVRPLGTVPSVRRFLLRLLHLMDASA